MTREQFEKADELLSAIAALEKTIEDIVNSLNDSCKFCPAKNCAICANKHKL